MLVGVGLGGHTGEQLAGINEIALGLNSVVFDVRSDHAIGQLCIVDAVVIGLDIAGEVLTDKAIEQCAQDILLEIPTVNGTSNIVGDLPDLALLCGTLLGASHGVVPVSIRSLLFLQSADRWSIPWCKSGTFNAI